jgi:protein associated with RNAse G/E
MPPALRVEKRKFDGTLSVVEHGVLVGGDDRAVAWFVPAGSERERPAKRTTEIVERDEIWAARPGEWWVLCGISGRDGGIEQFVLHAATPLPPLEPGILRWIDLDLDYEVHGEHVALEDEEEFHRHARTMHYPPEVIEGAWKGISTTAPHYTTGDWPFDGWLDRQLAAGRRQLIADADPPG